MPKILVLGSGGHGWQVLQDIFSYANFSINIFFLPCDWGGSTGLWGRLLEFNDQELNQILHKTKQPVLAWGDMNKVLVHQVGNQYGAEIGNLLNLRSNAKNQHLQSIEVLINQLKLGSDLGQKLINYTNTVLDFYLKNKDKLDFVETPLCLGNYLHDFLFWQFDEMEKWNEFWYLHGLSKNLTLNFTHNHRQIIIGEDIENKVLIGEEKIDESQTAIKPESFQLVNSLGKVDEIQPKLLKEIENSDLILIPPGSIANWMPLLQINTIQNQLRNNQKLIWIINTLRTENELNSLKYIQHLQTLNILTTLLIPEKELEISTFPSKKIPNLTLSDLDFIQKNYLYQTLQIQENGWQYTTESVRECLFRSLLY